MIYHFNEKVLEGFIMKRFLLAFIAIFLLLSAETFAQDDEIIHFPDSNFKWILVNMTDYSQPIVDLNGDGEIQRSEAEAYIHSLDISFAGDSIIDLTGIKAFINIGEIRLERCPGITTVDLSGMVNLRQVTFDYNPNLERLDVSGCINLKTLDCNDNKLQNLNISNCKNIFGIRCSNSLLTEIKTYNFLKLKYLFIRNSIILNYEISNVPELYRIQLQGNQLTSLDVSSLTKLDQLWVNDNKLTSLNIKNNNNTILTLLHTQNNPDLKCITVDDVAYSEKNWIEIDEWTEFSENCSTYVNDILQNTFKVYPNPANNSVTIEREGIEQVDLRILDITGKIFMSYTLPYGETQIRLDVSRLSAGKYIIEINDETNSFIIE